MDQNTQQFMHELKEFVHKAEKFLQSQGGESFGQRGGYYGQRDSQGGGYNQGSGYNQGGGYGQREQSWMRGPQNYPEQGWGNFPNIDPRYFM